MKPKLDLSIKKNAQEAHAKRRSRQRLGRDMNIKRVVMQIKRGQSQFIEKLSNNRTKHRVNIGGVQADVIYDKSRGTLITVLSLDNGGRIEKG